MSATELCAPTMKSVGALVLFCSAGVAADEDSQTLAAVLDSMVSYRADFEQVVTGQFGEVLQTATGTMHLERPGRLRWHVDEPYPQLVVADGEHVWVYDPDLEQVTVQLFEETVQGTPMMFLTDAATLKENFRVRMTSTMEESSQRFALSPRDRESASLFREITLTLSAAGLLTGLDIVDDLDQKTSVVFRRGEVNPVLESGLFEFEVPVGVDVIGNIPDDVPAESAP
ncbi:MAG: outer membrane lipoprotein chaperone LolA [Gammaproteobacteria bacterium]|nr:outer membrane lipoprotein chaperone LolA [Gammaproteobacteria bacterium]